MPHFCGIPFRVRQVLRAGGIIAYPTEGVYGLGCDPDDPRALRALIDIKRRDRSKGLIVIGANSTQLLPYIEAADHDTRERLIAALDTPSSARAVTWVVPASARCHPLLTGGRTTLAVRVTHHPTASRLCRAFGGALVSTSANTSGQAPIGRPALLIREFSHRVDAVLPRANGDQRGVSKIIDFSSGQILRA
ncbi:MAG: L-threonylcarbamoyladenylate synthase [Pseudomonadota bacterium]